MSQSSGHRALRKGRTSLSGQVYLLTTTTADRRPLFALALHARAVCQCMVDAACWPRCRLLCWVLMPDHWHGLVELDDGGNVSAAMNQWKSIAAKRLHRQGRPGKIWSRGFHDHAMRGDENVLHAARYIVANPLRAGLVSDVLAYPYWHCVWYTPYLLR